MTLTIQNELHYTIISILLLQKTFSENHITKRKIFNTGELPKYHAEDAHEAIIHTNPEKTTDRIERVERHLMDCDGRESNRPQEQRDNLCILQWH